MKLRVRSRTGQVRYRAGYVFTPTPVVIEASGIYPQDTPMCQRRGDWPPRHEPRERGELLLEDDGLVVERLADDDPAPVVDAEFRP